MVHNRQRIQYELVQEKEKDGTVVAYAVNKSRKEKLMIGYNINDGEWAVKTMNEKFNKLHNQFSDNDVKLSEYIDIESRIDLNKLNQEVSERLGVTVNLQFVNDKHNGETYIKLEDSQTNLSDFIQVFKTIFKKVFIHTFGTWREIDQDTGFLHLHLILNLRYHAYDGGENGVDFAYLDIHEDGSYKLTLIADKYK